MKRFLVIALLVAAVVVTMVSIGRVVTPASGGDQSTIPVDTVDSRLQEKADFALAFCKAKGFDTERCFLVDMKIHSGKNRFFVWDFNENKAVHSGLCCHGSGKGESTGSAPVFSNEEGSHCTSLGKYRIGERSHSRYGINIHYKLHGLEPTNSNAYKRIVVLHSFDPVPANEIYPLHLPMGFSLGCPVVSNSMMRNLDEYLKQTEKPVLLWIYY